MILSVIVLLLMILVIDFYGYYGLRVLFTHKRLQGYKSYVYKAYWIMDLAFIVFAISWTLVIRNSSWPDYVQYRQYFYITGAFLLIFLPKLSFLVFVLLHDLLRIAIFVIALISSKASKAAFTKVYYPLPLIGFVLSVFMFFWVVTAISYTRYDYRVEQVDVFLADLPEDFHGFRILQISDTHLGSFGSPGKVKKGVELMRSTPHDILVHTGDIVNNEAEEALKYKEMFSSINSPYGKFAVLGNHDMGDYRRWYTIEEKDANLQLLEAAVDSMGFELLRNAHVFITKGSDSIMIVGVDNWGLPPFSTYGDLEMALGAHSDFPLQVLLSHDPTHWRAQVLPETNIHISLSGHTHAMQMGIHTSFFKWSPSSWIYPEWAGLYEEYGQFLYVNRGFGFLGFPGRLGMPPELTLITLRAQRR